jgi:rRNA-processing protein FCF1
MKVLLDTNFIITCVKQKIDILNAEFSLEREIKWIVPIEVVKELEELMGRKDINLVDRGSAKLGLEILENLKPNYIELKNSNVDKGIENYLFGKDIVLATLDKALKRKVKNRKMIIRGKKNLEIV